jgi:hypothetical protein
VQLLSSIHSDACQPTAPSPYFFSTALSMQALQEIRTPLYEYLLSLMFTPFKGVWIATSTLRSINYP